ncbi:uncharacterized protein znf106b [Cottoperca gobio]|uniref:Uncharacterized protein LOC115028994 n=1 Tax=Cottoperca gobio TaxID=56716 RepID=A0A6J2S867_COTGO|nr:uncharacterized protein LOC115028994 [Cottoperca gobio]XP_029318844.1 uncharacterized protein LOC115028994 [Cottoperca gobio]XP_029318845.1 uncharacterized protein LOC115028994 [Cottoperca gobio]XP_029318846.1 uncharacterized protein LOC115028994 [Cottoperca gobio]
MLRQIRRALGVREPCRADREARKQNTEAGVRVADHSTMQQAGAEREQRAEGSFRNYAKELHSAAATSSQVNSPDQATFEMTQGKSCESDSNRPAMTRKVRIARKSAPIQGREPNQSRDNIFSFSVATSKSNWMEMYEEKKRKKQERGQGMPRFGIELANPLSTQDNDMTLSEGFHWESLQDSLSGAHWTGLPLPPQDTTYYDSYTETLSDSLMQEPLEEPGAAEEGCSSLMVEAGSMKMKPNSEYGDLRADSNASKRKHNVYDGVSDKGPSGKKKKTKSNKDQDQMDQLLAVSLREDELSHSLLDLDKSMVQARNTLQAAYTKVQRLLLLRQQCTAEVNSLRAQRIKILQGMKGVYAGASNIAEKAPTVSAGAAAATVQPMLSPLPSSSAFPTPSSQQPSPTIPAPSISPIALPTIPVKPGIVQPPPAGQASQSVSCNSDTLQVPANQPLPLFPSDLLPSLLLPSLPLAAPATAVTALKQIQTEGSTSENTNNLPESSARTAGGEFSERRSAVSRQ